MIAFTQNKPRMIEKVCSDCHEVYEVVNTSRFSSKRCPACAEARKKEKDLERNERDKQRHWMSGNVHTAKMCDYKLIYDPDNFETWGYNSHFNRREIKDLQEKQYIIEGCKFLNVKTGKYFEIVYEKKQQGLVMRMLDER